MNDTNNCQLDPYTVIDGIRYPQFAMADGVALIPDVFTPVERMHAELIQNNPQADDPNATWIITFLGTPQV